MQGFFLGPFIPVVMVVATKLLPKSHQISGIGFIAAFGAGGSAIIPFIIGAIAQARSVQVLQPFVVGILGAIMILWLGLPRIPKNIKNETRQSA